MILPEGRENYYNRIDGCVARLSARPTSAVNYKKPYIFYF